MAAPFPAPIIHDNDAGWGPGASAALQWDFPLETIMKSDRVGRVCDFSASGIRYREMRGKGQPEVQDPDGEDQFQLVDNTTIRPKGGKGFGKGKGKGKGKGLQKVDDREKGMKGGKGGKGAAKGKGAKDGKGKGKGKGKGRNNARSFKEWSIVTKPEWEVVTELSLAQLSKCQIDSRQIKKEDVCWCGHLAKYNKSFDRITCRLEKHLERFENYNFYNVTTSEDPVLQDMLANDEEVNVVITDQILACLMGSNRSIYSWDIVITKIGGKVIFDKRDGSHIDYLTVNETSNDPPADDVKDNINGPIRLGQEASCINQNFTQQVIDRATIEQCERPNPFDDDEDDSLPPAAGAYRYRKFKFVNKDDDDEPIVVGFRAEVDCQLPQRAVIEGEEQEPPQYVMARALNEFLPSPTMSWRKQLEPQRGAVLATELKNNAFRIARWTAQAMVADIDTLKLGYCTRRDPNDPWSHLLLGVQTYKVSDFASQIGISQNSIWGIFKSVVDLVKSYEDGKYVMVKDPTKSIIRVYAVPFDEFDEEEEDDEFMDEEDEM